MWRETVFDVGLASAGDAGAVVSNHLMREIGKACNLTSLLAE